MGFAAGDAHLTPNESKGAKRKGKVDIGAGKVTSVGDVPVGETARVEALVAGKRDDDVGLEAEAREWDDAFAASGKSFTLRRDKVEALYLTHLEQDPQTTGFKEAHAQRGLALVGEAERYMLAGSRTGELRLVAGASFSLLGRADRDFRALATILTASGHATSSEDGLAVDALRLAKEGGVLKTEAKESAAVQGMSMQTHGHANLLTAYTQLTNAIRGLTGMAYMIRSRSIRQRSGEEQAAVDLLQARVGFAESIDALVVAAAQALPMVGGVVKELGGEQQGASEGAALPSVQGVLARLIAGKEMKALRVAQAHLAGLAELHRSNEAQQEVESIRTDLAIFQTSADCFMTGAQDADEHAASRRDHLDTGGIAMDKGARRDGALDRAHERFRPMAQRVAYLESAHNSNVLGRSALGNLEQSARDAAETVDGLLTKPTSDDELFTLRRGLGKDNVPRAMSRRITRFQEQLGEQFSIVAAASQEPS